MYKLHHLSTGGTNTQGVPLGLVNWMCYNRAQKIQNKHDEAGTPDLRVWAHNSYQRRFRTTRPYDQRLIYLSAVLWADLALTLRGVFGSRGFVTINALDWSRHNATQ